MPPLPATAATARPVAFLAFERGILILVTRPLWVHLPRRLYLVKALDAVRPETCERGAVGVGAAAVGLAGARVRGDNGVISECVVYVLANLEKNDCGVEVRQGG